MNVINKMSCCSHTDDPHIRGLPQRSFLIKRRPQRNTGLTAGIFEGVIFVLGVLMFWTISRSD